ncbi:MAG TPA: tRNA adenosine(34) deaminase TadA [Spirochaetota bacterium]|nr:tRNA adenosine(34) deaminase TadA [Spirochaetota bacterium]HOH37533.1 tRNA adenosine(34) deaminase TadA [Spirochaetota bacterium]HPJ14182.1 tRNA adenosine(34) deaminase TadA [Spirochaetota bacterium]HPM33921.1 tRNA adenosine(34) deaminase TadA [Spirochaetota bacterium]HPY03375.1 tRNA adenosine(34) deaminase TadA [Spirochaetota bacterium]
MTTNDDFFMSMALKLAEEAGNNGEIPIGAVIVLDGKIIGDGKNSNREENNPTRHAEINAIESAVRAIGNERLINAELFVTKEPCAMCAGAIIHSRIKRVIISAKDIKYGACGTVFDILGNKKFNHIPEIVFGVMEKEGNEIIKNFFKKIRNSKKKDTLGVFE